MISRPRVRWLCASFGLLLFTLTSADERAEAQGRQLSTTGSGDWSDPIWLNRADPTDTRPPGPQDVVFILAGHEVTFVEAEPARTAAQINVYGSLSLPEPGLERPPALLWADWIMVRPEGQLSIAGPHTIILEGLGESFLLARPGASMSLRGRVTLQEGHVGRVASETHETMILVDDTRSWTPGSLTGQRLKFLDGRARLWSFTILDNGADSVVLDLESRGAPGGIAPFSGRIDTGDSRIVHAPAETFSPDPRGYRDRLIAGRWVRLGDTHHLVIGAHDGGGDAEDRLVLWPPLAREVERAEVAFTWGIEVGDTYTITDPVRVTLPEAHRLPALPSPGRQFYIHSGDSTHTVMEHVLIEYGFLDLRDVDVADPDEELRMWDIELAHADAGCVVTTKRLTGVVFEHFHIRDIHPNNDLEAFGGLWVPSDQRGHGVCYHGDDGILRDNLMTNLNDDMIYVAHGRNYTIEDNILMGSALFHGNSDENITLYNFEGEVSVRRNVALGAGASVLMQERLPGSSVRVEDNLFIQNARDAIFSDYGGEAGGSELVVANNAFLSGRGGRVLIVGRGQPARFENNFMVDVTLWQVSQARENIILGMTPHLGDLLLSPGTASSNLIAHTALQPGGALISFREATPSARITGNTLDAGRGVAVRFGEARANGIVTHNILRGAWGFDAAGEPPSPDLVLAFNIADGVPLSEAVWLRDHLDETNTTETLEWADLAQHQLPPDSPAFRADRPIGYTHAGLTNPESIPFGVALLPARRASVQDGGPNGPDALTPVIPDRHSPPSPAQPNRGPDETTFGPPDITLPGPQESAQPPAPQAGGCHTATVTPGHTPLAVMWFVLGLCGVSLRRPARVHPGQRRER